MPYKLLQPGEAVAVAEGCCALAVMAKAPRPGKVKTRLSPPLSPDQASALNICFIRDTTENIRRVAEAGNSAGIVAYTPVGDEAAFEGLLPPAFQLVAQRGDGFGERLLYACQDLFSCGFGAVCLIDSDSPTLPQEALRQAVAWLARPGDRVVLGGSDDGGYYLIGVKRLHPRLFEQIDWSTERVLAQTLERAREIGLTAELLPTWYDVDDAATLERLRRELLAVPGEGRRVRRDPHPCLSRDHRMLTRPWLTNSVLVLLGLALLGLSHQGVNEIHHFVIGFGRVAMYQSLLYLVAVWVVLNGPVNRWTLVIIVACAAGCRLICLFSPPFLSTDISAIYGTAACRLPASIPIAIFRPIRIWPFCAISKSTRTSIDAPTPTPFTRRERRCSSADHPHRRIGALDEGRDDRPGDAHHLGCWSSCCRP